MGYWPMSWRMASFLSRISSRKVLVPPGGAHRAFTSLRSVQLPAVSTREATRRSFFISTFSVENSAPSCSGSRGISAFSMDSLGTGVSQAYSSAKYESVLSS